MHYMLLVLISDNLDGMLEMTQEVSNRSLEIGLKMKMDEKRLITNLNLKNYIMLEKVNHQGRDS